MRRTATVLILPVLLMTTGCFLSPSDRFEARDGSAGMIASEFTSMGGAVEELFGAAAGLEKSAAGTTEPMYVDVVIYPWTYDEAGYWRRRSEAHFDKGTRTREDTVWLRDAAGSPVRTPGFGAVAGYRHVRATRTSANNVFEGRYDVTVSIRTSGADTTFTWNGACAGSVNGSRFRSSIIADVVRVWKRGTIPHFGFPRSGTVDVDLPLRAINITFTGQGGATAVVTRKRDNEQFVFVINVHSGTESEQ